MGTDRKRNGMKGQVSMEYLLVIGFALLMVIPIVIIFFMQSETIKYHHNCFTCIFKIHLY